MVRFLVARSKRRVLRRKTLSLVDRVVQLGVRVAHFPRVDEQLKALHLRRVARLLFRQRRNRQRVVHDERRLNELLLAVFLKEQVDDVAFRVTLLIFNVVLFCKRLRFFVGLHFVKVDARILLDGVVHRQARKRLREVDFHTVIRDDRAAAHLLGKVTEHVLRQLHHAVIIRVGLVKLHQRELRVVARIDALVAEHTANLVNLFKAAYDEALQVKLQRNTQLHVFVQRVIMRLKRTRRRTAGIRNQHRGLHFHKSSAVEEIADLLNDLRALYKRVLHFRVHDEIDVSLAVAHIGVRQAVELLRQHLQALREQRHSRSVNGNLAGFCLEHLAAHADDVADVKFLKILVAVFAHSVTRHIALDAAL